jgi:membrane-bound lytic murein transglycosylase B
MARAIANMTVTRLMSKLALAAAALAPLLAAHAQSAPQNPPTMAPGTQQPQVFEEEIVPQRYLGNPAVARFIDDMVARYDFDADALRTLFGRVSYSASAVKLVTPSPTPGTKNWHAYQARFIEPIRINAGVKFWRDNQVALQQVSQQTGVPPEIIVAIIGVETLYGHYMGNFRVLDVLTTLSFNYPDTPNREERQATFRKNLEDYLVWTRNAGIDPTTLTGSYTGAIGIPQFLPSSILEYAVSYNGTGPVDLRNNPSDAIASVANYLKKQGWEPGRPVEWRIASDAGSQGIAQAAADGLVTPHWQLSQLLRAGMLLDEPNIRVADELSTPIALVDLPTPASPTEYTLGLQNFYVLTRYNHSFFYAQAVYLLARQVAARMQQVALAPATPYGGIATATNLNGGLGNTQAAQPQTQPFVPPVYQPRPTPGAIYQGGPTVPASQ